MKQSEVSVGKVYAVKVSSKLAPVMLTSVSHQGGWNALNLKSQRGIRIHTAAKLRYEVIKDPTTQIWRRKI
jgi:hypothetical protein